MLCSNILYILLANIYITLRQIESARNQLLLFSILSLFPSWRFYFFRHPPNDGFSRCELRDTVVHESSRNVANFLDLTLNTWILLSSSPLCFPLLSPFIPPVVRFKRFSRRHWRENLNFEKERKVISVSHLIYIETMALADGFSLPTRTFGSLGDYYYHYLKGGDKKFLTELILLGKVSSTRISLSYYYLRIYFTQFLIARSISFQRRVD